jgi:hypothetical protein
MGQTVGSFEQDLKSMFWHVEIIIVIILSLYSMFDNGHTLKPIDDSMKVLCITNKGNCINSIKKYYTHTKKIMVNKSMTIPQLTKTKYLIHWYTLKHHTWCSAPLPLQTTNT